jgi:hypothetical protein
MQEKQMADTKESRTERRKAPRKVTAATPKPDTKAAAPRTPTSAQRASAPMTSNVTAEVSNEEARRLIAEAAYYRAKQRNFAPGHELEDWIEAESEVMGRLNGRSH